MAETSYDLIVAGAGTGGIIMAARIAQRESLRPRESP